MRDLQKNTSLLNSQDIEVAIDTNINWRGALSSAICKPESSISAERSWAKLCESMRSICPETNWITISEEENIHKNEKAICSINIWLRDLVVSPDWSFPENIILMTGKEKENHWKLIFFDKNIKLPYAPPPHNILIIPWSDKHTSGWKIIPTDTFNSNNTGEA